MKILNWMTTALGFSNISQLAESVMPSLRYKLTIVAVFIGMISPTIDKLFGLDEYAFAAFVIILFAEITSGIIASMVRGETWSSLKFGRFTFKVFYYVVVVSVTYLMYQHFRVRGKDLPAWVFDWLHTYLIVHIVIENMISVLENVAEISGKEKSHWLDKIQDKVTKLF